MTKGKNQIAVRNRIKLLFNFNHYMIKFKRFDIENIMNIDIIGLKHNVVTELK